MLFGAVIIIGIIVLKHTNLINHDVFLEPKYLTKVKIESFNHISILKHYYLFEQFFKVLLIDEVWFSFIALSLLLVFLGVIGTYGVTKGHDGIKPLKAYICLFIVIFIVHNVFLNYTGFRSYEVETRIKENIHIMAEKAEKFSKENQNQFNTSCIAIKSLSAMLQCCDIKGECCARNTSGSCSEKVIDIVKTRIEVVIIVGMLLTGEFLIILMGSFMLGNALKSRDYNKDDMVRSDSIEIESTQSI